MADHFVIFPERHIANENRIDPRTNRITEAPPTANTAGLVMLVASEIILMDWV